jgi:PBP1b-binding outer membrane lipoprotein LpoB
MLTDIKTGLIYKIYKMKKTYSFSLILLLLIVSCKKPTDFYNELGKGTTLTLVKQNNGLLNAVDPISSVSIVINFNGSPVESVNLYVATSPTKDKTKWKLIKNIPFSGEG